MDAVFPLIKKYGGVAVGLTLDEEGSHPRQREGSGSLERSSGRLRSMGLRRRIL